MKIVLRSRFVIFSGLILSSSLLLSCLGGGSGSGGLTGSANSGATNLSSISQLPTASEMIATSEAGSASLRFAVSGTPPTLSTIADSETSPTAAEVFWPGLNLAAIADGSTTPNFNDPDSACFEFYGSEQDGRSGGFAACYMAQSVGYTFEPVIQSGGSFCYMKNIPTLASVTIAEQGSNPALEDKTTIFDQGASTRTVRVNVTGDEEEGGSQSVFIRVFGTDEVGSDRFRVSLWFCSPGGELRGSENYNITKSTGEITLSSQHDDEWGQNTVSIRGFLRTDNEGFRFDEDGERLIALAHSWSEGGNSGTFKSEVRITNENYIYAKTYDVSEFESQQWGRKAYSVSEFNFPEGPQKVGNIQFLQAAVKEKMIGEDSRGDSGFTASVEYRDDGYYSAPSSSLRSLLSRVNLDSDAFYASAPSVSVNLSASEYPCDATPDYIVTMDFGEVDVAAVQEQCDGDRLDGMDFCWSNTVRQAENNIITACYNNP